jgi:hypothetical protein
MSWHRFAEEAPALAVQVRSRLEAHRHHVLGTIRPDGAPRLSGSEAHVVDGELTIGMMAGSRKLADVSRDPRVELHTAPIEPDLAEGDAKLWGVAIAAASLAEPAGTMFRIELAGASLVRVEGDELVLSTWRPGAGAQQIRRR